jgi:hypothetical protein
MRNIYDLRSARDSEDHAFHDADKRIVQAEVGGERYNHSC